MLICFLFRSHVVPFLWSLYYLDSAVHSFIQGIHIQGILFLEVITKMIILCLTMIQLADSNLLKFREIRSHPDRECVCRSDYPIITDFLANLRVWASLVDSSCDAMLAIYAKPF